MARCQGESCVCPECGRAASRHDSRRRRWRHLPTCQYRTILTADVPRVRCAEHGVRTVGRTLVGAGLAFHGVVGGSGDRLAGRGEHLGGGSASRPELGQVSGVMERAVQRGLERRGAAPASRVLGVDETSFQKRHEYVTVVADTKGEPRVHHVADGRGKGRPLFVLRVVVRGRAFADQDGSDGHVARVHLGDGVLPARRLGEDPVRQVPCRGSSRRRGGRGAQGGAPQVARSGRRRPDRHALPVAVPPGPGAGAPLASLQGVDRRHHEDGALLALEGGGDDDVGDPGPRRGAGHVQGLVLVGRSAAAWSR